MCADASHLYDQTTRGITSSIPRQGFQVFLRLGSFRQCRSPGQGESTTDKRDYCAYPSVGKRLAWVSSFRVKRETDDSEQPYTNLRRA
jgi:hypothetical protein